MLNKIIISIILFGSLVGTALAAPTSTGNIFRTLLPESNNLYNIGASGRIWANSFFGTSTVTNNLLVAGNVGIGTTTPQNPLHLWSTTTSTLRIDADALNTGSEETNPNLILTQDGGFNLLRLGIGGTAGTQYTGQIINASFLEAKAQGDLQLVTGGISSSTTATDGTARITIQADGDIGFGTSTPVNGTYHFLKATGDAILLVQADPTNVPEDDNPQVRLSQDGNLVNGIFGIGGSTSQYNQAVANATFIEAQDNGGASPLQFVTGGNIIGGTAGTARMTILYGGNVGIGTTTPQAKLEVAGGIQISGTGTNKVLMQTGSAGTADRLDYSAVTTNRGMGLNLFPNGTSTFTKMALSNASSTTNFGSLMYAVENGNAFFAQQSVGTPTTGVTNLYLGSLSGSASGAGNWTNVMIPGGRVGIGTTTVMNGKFVVDTQGAWNLASTYPFQFINRDGAGNEGHAMLIQGGALSVNSQTLTVKDYNGTTNFNIDGNGTTYMNYRLGITTTTPQYALDAYTGTVRANALRADGTGSTNIEIRTTGGTPFIDFTATSTAANTPDYDYRIINNRSYLGMYNISNTGTGFYLSPSNSVGIGTTTPTYKLQVDSGASDDTLKLNSTRNIATQAQMLIYAQKGTNSTDNDRALIVFNHDKRDNSGVMAAAIGSRVFSSSSATGLGLDFTTGGTTSKMVLNNSGVLGIGTTAPTGANANVLLDTRGHIRAALSSEIGTYYFSSTSTNPYLGFGAVAGTWVFADNNSNKMAIVASTGYVGIGTTAPSSTLQIGTPLNATHSYLQLDFTTSTPSSADCDAQNEVGRTIMASTTARLIYTCWGIQGWATSTPSF